MSKNDLVYNRPLTSDEIREDQPAFTNGKPRTMRVRFGQNIKQIDQHTVEIELTELPYPIFTEEHIKTVCGDMGIIRGEMMLEEMSNEMIKRRILDGVKTS